MVFVLFFFLNNLYSCRFLFLLFPSRYEYTRAIFFLLFLFVSFHCVVVCVCPFFLKSRLGTAKSYALQEPRWTLGNTAYTLVYGAAAWVQVVPDTDVSLWSDRIRGGRRGKGEERRERRWGKIKRKDGNWKAWEGCILIPCHEEAFQRHVFLSVCDGPWFVCVCVCVCVCVGMLLCWLYSMSIVCSGVRIVLAFVLPFSLFFPLLLGGKTVVCHLLLLFCCAAFFSVVCLFICLG